MKKLISVLLACLLSLCALCAYASNTVYNVDKAGISISLPRDMYVFTPDVSPDDERLAALGLSYDGLMSAFDAKDMYLEAMDTENFNEIVVICQDTTEPNYYELGYDGIYNAVMAEETAIEKSGRKIVSADLYESNHVDFSKIVSSGKDYQVEYTTVYNKRKIKIKYLDFDGSFTEDESELFESIIDTVKFNQSPVKSEQKSGIKSSKEPESKKEAKETVAPVAEDADAESDANGNESSDGKADIDPDVLWSLIIAIAIAIVICTVPALFFRFVFSGGGLRSGGAFAFALFYSLAMAVLFYFAPDKIPQLNVSRYICIVPLVWSFVIYKIVKR